MKHFRHAPMWVVNVWGWFRGRFGGRRMPHFPAMFRVRDSSGALVPRVELVGTFEPGRRALRKRQLTASGLCMVHWPETAERLLLEIRWGEEIRRVEVSTKRAEPDRVIEVQLERALASAS
ncbi:MAG: hypothetical protein H6721_30645 [Sandaracinus sp.]|nr:hypothetical protein [Sandaracinus sp.]MCB9636490.1 hypothetical protein [Sandaracinus sp.]